jgi:hypothetical protein
MTITVKNPWSGNFVEIDAAEVTQSRLDAMAVAMDDETREELHSAQDWSSPGAFFAAYAERVGPEAAGVIWFS